MAKEKKKIFENDTNNIHNRFSKKSIKKSTKKKYEYLNIVSETRDSIYTVPMEESATIGEGQVYISLSEIKRIVNEELERRLGPSVNNKNEY